LGRKEKNNSDSGRARFEEGKIHSEDGAPRVQHPADVLRHGFTLNRKKDGLRRRHGGGEVCMIVSLQSIHEHGW